MLGKTPTNAELSACKMGRETSPSKSSHANHLLARNDKMVEQRHVQFIRCVTQARSNANVAFARPWISAWIIM